ncbi:hypothetical protein [Vreelandella malpeensis]|uniref:Uncharacterized protein n=1 Tax=Vreelandella malpeensis TaxID=1172368 RepID=A0ABS8DUI5_9GAMM|nr:hypothetical protein [Halomonas malpeensis]MCB8889928.1 hypothetical protein [Halomonas malpeensis]
MVQRIYGTVLGGANKVLRNCKKFPIEVLQLEDPTYTQMAQHLRELCAMLEALDDDSNLLVTKAHEYANHVRAIAAAIEMGDQSLLDRMVEELDKRSFL